MFFNFWELLLKMYIFEVTKFFSYLVFIQTIQFFSGCTYLYKVRVFDEVVFLLTIRMPMIVKIFRVVTCCKELSPIYMHDIKQSGFVGLRGK